MRHYFCLANDNPFNNEVGRKVHIFSLLVIFFSYDLITITGIQAPRKWNTIDKIALSDQVYTRSLQTSVTIIYF